jgi:hypothetical protein
MNKFLNSFKSVEVSVSPEIKLEETEITGFFYIKTTNLFGIKNFKKYYLELKGNVIVYYECNEKDSDENNKTVKI